MGSRKMSINQHCDKFSCDAGAGVFSLFSAAIWTDLLSLQTFVRLSHAFYKKEKNIGIFYIVFISLVCDSAINNVYRAEQLVELWIEYELIIFNQFFKEKNAAIT